MTDNLSSYTVYQSYNELDVKLAVIFRSQDSPINRTYLNTAQRTYNLNIPLQLSQFEVAANQCLARNDALYLMKFSFRENGRVDVEDTWVVLFTTRMR